MTCGDDSCATNTLHTRLWVQRAPGIPHALISRGERFLHDSDASRREIADLYLGHVGAGL